MRAGRDAAKDGGVTLPDPKSGPLTRNLITTPRRGNIGVLPMRQRRSVAFKQLDFSVAEEAFPPWQAKIVGPAQHDPGNRVVGPAHLRRDPAKLALTIGQRLLDVSIPTLDDCPRETVSDRLLPGRPARILHGLAQLVEASVQFSHD